jgi:hypothetical protein
MKLTGRDGMCNETDKKSRQAGEADRKRRQAGMNRIGRGGRQE